MRRRGERASLVSLPPPASRKKPEPEQKQSAGSECWPHREPTSTWWDRYTALMQREVVVLTTPLCVDIFTELLFLSQPHTGK